MKNKQLLRTVIQSLSVILTCFGFFYAFHITTMFLMVSTLILGTFFCGWVCPFGTIQELFTKLAIFLHIKQIRMPYRLHRYFIYTRYVLATLMLIISADVIFTLMSYNPEKNFSLLLSGRIVSWSAYFVMFILSIISLKFERFFCNYLCPEGAKLGLIGLPRVLSIQRNDNTCVSCKKCDQLCPMQIKITDFELIRSPQCINCFKCLDVCPIENTMIYTKVSLKTYFTLPKFANKKMFVLGLLIVMAFAINQFIQMSDAVQSEPTKTNTNVTTITFDINDTPMHKHGYEDEETFSEDGTALLNNSSDSKSDYQEENNTPSINPSTNEPTSDPSVIPHGVYLDGVYQGKGYGFKGFLTAEVTVVNGFISNIEIIKHREDLKWYNRAIKVMPSAIISAQSTEVDTVSGATFSSIGIRDAVKDALKEAK